MQGVDEIRVEEFLDGGDPAAQPDILAVRGFLCLLEDRGRVAVDEVERGISEGERRALVVVITNTGVWNGGSSPHHPSHS